MKCGPNPSPTSSTLCSGPQTQRQLSHHFRDERAVKLQAKLLQDLSGTWPCPSPSQLLRGLELLCTS